MNHRSLVFLAPLVVTACVDAPDLGDGAQSITPSIGPGSGGRENGRHKLGLLADAQPGAVSGQYFSVTPSGYKVIRSSNAGPCLAPSAASACGASVNGAIFYDANNVARLQINATVSFTGGVGQPMTGYLVKYNQNWNNGGAVSWVTYCKDDRLAYPLDETVMRDGTFAASGLSFACSEYDQTGVKPTTAAGLTGNGVVAKVMSWGFLPDFVSYQSMGGFQITGEGLFQRMVSATTADYCGNGGTHTIDATQIEPMDLVPGNVGPDATGQLDPAPLQNFTITPEAASSTMQLEGFWSGKAPLCLSKLRWSTLPVGDRCTASGQVLHDPRIVPAGGGGSVYCEDYTSLTAVAASGAMVAVNSRYNDAGLWRWKNPTTFDHYTTTLGSYTGPSRTDSVAPAAGYDTSTTPLYLGAVLTSAGKAAFEAAYPTNGGTLVELKSCKKNNDWITTAPSAFAVPAGYASCKTEGYLWSTSAQPGPLVTATLGWTMQSLYLYKKTSGADYLTTTAATAPAGYTSVATLGTVVMPSSSW